MNKRITIDPKIMVGKPVIKGTRIPVYLILNLLNHGYDAKRICEAYPILKPADIKAAMEYSEKLLNRERVYIPSRISYAKTAA
jgi:uncharacterized protein (DUF433 family)